MSPERLALDAVFREAHGRILASLIGGLRDFDLAEDSLQEAFATAIETWPRDGVPRSPASWLITTARRKALDRLRRQQVGTRKLAEAALLAALEREEFSPPMESVITDERLRLIFTCCHPALPPEARAALTLRTLGGLTTGEIARAFLVPEATLAQRLVRAKQKIRDAGIPYAVPADGDLPERLGPVLTVVYLVFNEGYSATSADTLVRRELCSEAIRLGRLLVQLMPDEPEARGLLALMLLHDSRRDTRVDPITGQLVLLEDQDRSRWVHQQIDEGIEVLETALRRHRPGPYQLQAAIAAVHAEAATPAETDWRQIAALYERLAGLVQSPVVELNWAVAVAMVDGPERGLTLVAPLAERLDAYQPYHATRADFLRRLGRPTEAAEAYERAIEMTSNGAELGFLKARLGGL
ncbi:MAG: RNA polymerase sigma factor [Anaerolineaceae bacterium]